MTEVAMVLFSGGQDSATCLAWALDHFDAVETIGFDYGQRHAVELEVRNTALMSLRRDFPDWARRLSEDHLIDLSVLGEISETALTSGGEIALQANGLPNTFVPGRNLMFLTFAAALAYRRGARHIVIGVCETDYSGYPDCRDDAIKAMQLALNIGMDSHFIIHTPLMWIDKAATWSLAEQLGGDAPADLICRDTHTCYHGIRDKRHDWGYGCGTCPACELRRDGYLSFASAPRRIQH